jgi:hypothetical protein
MFLCSLAVGEFLIFSRSRRPKVVRDVADGEVASPEPRTFTRVALAASRLLVRKKQRLVGKVIWPPALEPHPSG